MFDRRRWLILALVAAVVAAVVDGGVAQARALRILTYNIHRALGRDNVYDVQRIANVIKAANPDLVALQEVDQGTSRSGPGDMQLDMLAQLTGLTGRYGKTLNRFGGEYGNAVLVDPSITILGVNNMTMPNPADGELRKVMKVRLEFDDDGTMRRVDFFATHMDHTSGTNRQAQVDFINAEVADSNIPAILAGDFNFDDQGAAYNKLVQQWEDPTAENPGRPSQIDYVVYRGEDQWRVRQEGRFIVNSTTANASDHYPLLAVLELYPYTADFDRDGDVDGADFMSWQRNVGGTGPNVVGDANHDRVVNAADRAIWEQQFAAAAASGSVPEPTGAAIAVASLGLGVLNHVRRKRGA